LVIVQKRDFIKDFIRYYKVGHFFHHLSHPNNHTFNRNQNVCGMLIGHTFSLAQVLHDIIECHLHGFSPLYHHEINLVMQSFMFLRSWL
jgi:hypothetical protein